MSLQKSNHENESFFLPAVVDQSQNEKQTDIQSLSWRDGVPILWPSCVAIIVCVYEGEGKQVRDF